MESLSAKDMDQRLLDLACHERGIVAAFVLELAAFGARELHRELGYTSLFYYCVRQLGLPKSSAFRRSEVARLIARFPAIEVPFLGGRLSIRALLELREVLTEENHAAVLARAEGMNQEQAQLLAVEVLPKPVPRDVCRAIPLSLSGTGAAEIAKSVPKETAGTPARTSAPPESIQPLTPQLRRLGVTVSAEFMAELELVRDALSHPVPDGDFERVVRAGFKLLLEQDRKRKGLTEKPRPQKTAASGRSVPAAVKREVWKRDEGRCTTPMGDGQRCGATRKLEFDHHLEVALGGESTVEKVRLLCKTRNLMKAERNLGRALMSKYCGRPPPHAPRPGTERLFPGEGGTVSDSLAFRSGRSPPPRDESW